MMDTKNFHKDFRLNGRQFSSDKEIIAYCKENIPEIIPFLTEWFSNDRELIVQTSGSTGMPKKIAIHKKFMINSAIATGEFFNLQAKTKALLCLSPSYIAGKMMLVRAMVLGWNLDVIAPVSLPLRKNKTYDFVAMVPLQVQKSIKDLYKVKLILVGGGVLDKKILDKITFQNTKIFQSYGMTETVTHIAVRELYPNFENRYSALKDVKITIDSRNCLVINAPKVAEDSVITNDLVEILDNSHFKWLGRVDNIINSGGIKLVPEQIEDKLQSMISVPFFISKKQDDLLGEKVVLFVEGSNDNMLLHKLKKSDLLTKYEMPKEVAFVDEFVRTETGKINRILTKPPNY